MNKINEFLSKPFFNVAGLDITPAMIVLLLLIYMVLIRRK